MILVPTLFYLDDIKWHPVIFHFAFQDVMVVGEPSLMGGDFGEEDERLISRLENSQYDPAAAAAQHAAAAQVGRPVG